MNVAGILLAAGMGRRFDPSGARNKLLETVHGELPVAVASARAMLASLDSVVAVVPSGAGPVAAALRAAGCEIVVCEDAALGMAASLVAGVRHCRSASGWIIALADMPHVSPATIAALHRALGAGAGIAVPVHGGRRGNPVGFAGQYLPELLALQGDQGARAIVRANVVTELHLDDPGVLLDIDTPSDLHKTVTLSMGGPSETS